MVTDAILPLFLPKNKIRLKKGTVWWLRRVTRYRIFTTLYNKIMHHISHIPEYYNFTYFNYKKLEKRKRRCIVCTCTLYYRTLGHTFQVLINLWVWRRLLTRHTQLLKWENGTITNMVTFDCHDYLKQRLIINGF